VITDLMCFPATYDSFSQDQQSPLTFIAQTLHDQIAARLPELVSEIGDHCHDTIAEIVADQQRVEPRRERLEKARDVGKRKIRERIERYAHAADHVNAKRWDAAETACAPPQETTTFAPATGDMVN
jgi:uncharacterized membrane protein YccC